MEERRANDLITPAGDTARILAIMYTFGFLAFVFTVAIRGIPAEAKDIVLQLIGILSLIQAGIVKFYFDGSRQAELGQRAAVVGRAAADATIQEIAKTAPSSMPIALPVVPTETQPKGP